MKGITPHLMSYHSSCTFRHSLHVLLFLLLALHETYKDKITDQQMPELKSIT